MYSHILLCLAAFTALSTGAVIKRQADELESMYIVTWKDGLSAQEYEAKNEALESMIFGIQGASEETKPVPVDFGSFHSIYTYLTPEAKAELENDSNVLHIEPRIEMRAFATQSLDASMWNLDMLDGVMDNSLTYPDNCGQGVNVYVIDTGIVAGHTDFSNRASLAANFATGNPGTGDAQGHGTHVAGTVGGANFGIAKLANIMGVRVLGNDGSGSNQAVIRGIEFAVQNSGGRNCVINMSLGGNASPAVDAAVRSASAQGCVVVVAAGNENQNACNVSPSREPSAITVAASNITGTLASFTNFGTCVDIIAPGVRIVSASNTNTNGGSRSLSGTSMASPLVAGAAACLISQGVAPSQVSQTLISMAASGGITGNLRNTPDRLLSLASLLPQPAPAPAPAAPFPELPEQPVTASPEIV